MVHYPSTSQVTSGSSLLARTLSDAGLDLTIYSKILSIGIATAIPFLVKISPVSHVLSFSEFYGLSHLER